VTARFLLTLCDERPVEHAGNTIHRGMRWRRGGCWCLVSISSGRIARRGLEGLEQASSSMVGVMEWVGHEGSWSTGESRCGGLQMDCEVELSCYLLVVWVHKEHGSDGG
jgi:hypothetical protein